MTDPHYKLGKPKNVILAVQFLWVGLAISLLNTALNWDIITTAVSEDFPQNFPIGLTTFILIIQGITNAFMIWMFLKISSGRNWARILFAILTIIGVPFSIPSIINYFNLSIFMFILLLITLLLNIAALGLLFTNSASVWFKNLKALRKQKAVIF